MKLDSDMRAILESQRLCYVATVTPEGRPNLSPKGTIRVWDETRIFFLDIASPTTRRNLENDPWIEVNVVDPLSRRGYRFLGEASLLTAGPLFDAAVNRVLEEDGVHYPVSAVVMIEVRRAAPLVSPGYYHVRDEREMRNLWRRRRTDLEHDFDAHIEAQGYFRAPESLPRASN